MALTETEVVERLHRCRVVPVATLESPNTAPNVARALQAGGISCIEVTFRHPAATEVLKALRAVDGVLVGAGTVVSAQQAEAACAAGAGFAVAPGFDGVVVERCRTLGLPFFPGVATPTEIGRAQASGCSVVKVFPAAQVGGPAFIRAVSAVYPDQRFIPTGGVNIGNLQEYLAIPAVVACGGSWLVPAELVRERRYSEIERLARAVSEAAG